MGLNHACSGTTYINAKSLTPGFKKNLLKVNFLDENNLANDHGSFLKNTFNSKEHTTKTASIIYIYCLLNCNNLSV